jgi:hypothetical protein
VLEYWHIGLTAMRFRISSPRIASDAKSAGAPCATSSVRRAAECVIAATQGQRSRSSAGSTCFTSSISPSVMCADNTEKTPRAAASGSTPSAGSKYLAIPARN